MIKHFSIWEVIISGVIVLALAFLVLGSVAILFRTNKVVSDHAQSEKCITDIERIIKNELQTADTAYLAEVVSDEINLKRIEDSPASASGIAIASREKLKVLYKNKIGKKFSYFYSSFQLEDKTIVKISEALKTVELSSEKCLSASGQNPFSLRTIVKHNSNSKAIELIMDDKISSADKDIKLYFKSINEFN